jgi:hypothetical protein
VQPPPLALQGSQFFQRVGHLTLPFHRHSNMCSRFVLFLLHPPDAACKHLRTPRTRVRSGIVGGDQTSRQQ